AVLEATIAPRIAEVVTSDAEIEEDGFVGNGGEDSFDVGETIVQSWKITNKGTVDIVEIEIEWTKSNQYEFPGYMEMWENLEKPLRPGETATFTTRCTANERMEKYDDWEETIQFTCFPERGAAFGVEAETESWTMNVGAEIEADGIDGKGALNWFHVGDTIEQTWEITNTGTVDIVEIEIEWTKSNQPGSPGYMEMEKNLEEPLHPGDNATFTTRCKANKDMEENTSAWFDYWEETIQFKCFRHESGTAFGVEAETDYWIVKKK
ncbi:MAG: hypothetical protein U0L09_00505, partial [Christensenellales bacterium]|nr:hypothetical protein [Christensenellales bacterium]